MHICWSHLADGDRVMSGVCWDFEGIRDHVRLTLSIKTSAMSIERLCSRTIMLVLHALHEGYRYPIARRSRVDRYTHRLVIRRFLLLIVKRSDRDEDEKYKMPMKFIEQVRALSADDANSLSAFVDITCV